MTDFESGIALINYIASRSIVEKEVRDRFPYCRATESRSAYRQLLDAATTQIWQSLYIDWHEFVEWRNAIGEFEGRGFCLKTRSRPIL